jgi:hypothetical protein
MGRLGLGILAAAAVAGVAHGQDAPSNGKNNPLAAEAAAANAHCAALGEGFFAVAGSATCMRISGHVSAGVGFATGNVAGHAFGATRTGSVTEEGMSSDVRFDTPMGPGRIYVHVGNANGSRWLVEGQ